MNELEAAVGIEQLKRVNEFLELRHANNEKLRRALEDVTEIFLRDDVKFEIFKKFVKSGSLVRCIVQKILKIDQEAFLTI